eukprot:gene20059-22028_t
MIVDTKAANENLGPSSEMDGINIQDSSKQNNALDALINLQETYGYYGNDYIKDNHKSAVKLIAIGLEDSSLNSRKIALELAAKIIPCLETEQDAAMLINQELIPRCVQNLCHFNSAIKKSAVQTIHVYMKHFHVRDVVSIIIQKINDNDAKVRTELMVALPVIITPAFAEEDIYEFISSLVHRLEISSVKTEHNPPSLVCLERIKSVLGENIFLSYINRLPERLQREYTNGLLKSSNSKAEAERTNSSNSLSMANSNHSLKSTKNCSYVARSSSSEHLPIEKKPSTTLDNTPKPVNSAERIGLIRARSTEKTTKGKYAERPKRLELFDSGYGTGEIPHSGKETLHYGFIPSSTMAELEDSSWKTRARGIEELKFIIEGIKDRSAISNIGDFLEMITRFVHDHNFKILLTSLQILCNVLEIIGEEIRPHLELMLAVVQNKLGDSKTIVKQLNVQIALKLMKFAKPWLVINAMIPIIKHRNSKVREDVVNIITAALLTFPSSDFKLGTLPGFISNLLLDPKRRVRQAVLECFAVISQALGPGRMQPLVSAVDMVELSTDGEGVMEAVQARLARRRLPKLTTDCTLEYSMPISSITRMTLPLSPDVSWILYSSVNGEPVKVSGDGSPKRYCSAGKKRLPWENGDTADSNPFRKSVGSAPLRSQEDREVGKQADYAGPRSSWAAGGTVEKFQLKGRLDTMPTAQDNATAASETEKNDTAGSYFRMYKQRMRKFKQAGLQADNTMINTLANSRASPLATLDPLHTKRQVVRKNSVQRDAILAPSSLSPVRTSDTSPVPPFEDKQLSASWAGSEFGDNHGWQNSKKPSDLVPLGNGLENGSQRDIESPVHVKPTLAKSASKKRRSSHSEPERVSPPAVKAEYENDDQAKKSANQERKTVDPLANIRQQAATLKQQKREEEEGSFHGGQPSAFASPFESRPKIARSPSARKLKSRAKIADHSSSDASDSLSPREGQQNEPIASATRQDVAYAGNSMDLSGKFDGLRLDNGMEKELHGDRNAANEVSRSMDSAFVANAGRNRDIHRQFSEDLGRTSRDNSSEDWKKSYSGLSKSALERVQKKRSEEIKKRELAVIKMREKEAEEKLRIEREAAEAEDRKKAQLEQTMSEMKRLEDLIKMEERRKEEELEKKRLAEEARRKEELRLKRERQAKLDDDEMKKAEEEMKSKDMSRRDERMKELEDMIKVEEKRQNEIRKMKEDMKREEEEKEFRRKEELRKQKEEEELRLEIEEEKRKKAEAELKEARRKKAELRRLKEQQLKQEIEAREREEEEARRAQLDMTADSIELEAQEGQGQQFGAFEVNLGSCDRKNKLLTLEDTNNNYTKPAESMSPMPRRKANNGRGGRAHSGSHIVDQVDSANIVTRSSTEGDILQDLLNPYKNPDQAIRDALRSLGASSEDWETKCSGLLSFRRLAKHHPDFLAAQIHTVCLAISTEVRNLRSQVSRSAISCLGEIVMYLPKPMEPELDLIVNNLLSKSGESNSFIKQDVEQSLQSIVDNMNSVKAMGAFINNGAGHKNAQVRKMCARFLSKIAEKMGPAKLLNGSKEITDRILPVAAQFAIDGNQETRHYGRCILYLMINHPELDKLLEKHLPKTHLRPVKDIVENIKMKGPGEAPSEHGSAAVRRSGRYTGSGVTRNSEVRSSAFSNSRKNSDVGHSIASKTSARASTKRTTRQSSQVEGYQAGRQQVDMDSIAGLNANDWKTRSEAIENLYDMVCTNPEGVEKHVSKVFDNFMPRLTDSNSKVNLQALQTMNKSIPILRDALSPMISMLMQALTSCVASKNNSIYNSAMEVLVSLTKYVDNLLLLQPLVSAVRYGNTRVKPEMAMRLADLVTPVFQRKPNLIQTQIFPVLWHLLSNPKSGSAANARNDLNTATSKLCEELYICYGESLYDEAANQSKEMAKKLRYYMM